jgi:NADH-ubiquinone oxidoreductase chain 1
MINYFVIPLCQVIIVLLPALLSVAYVTVAERKTMGSMQRRLGPNVVGFYGLLQAFADALKLLLKEYVSPSQSNIILFFIGPVVTLMFSLLGYAVIPYTKGISLLNFDLSLIYLLAMSSLATYGILLAGWSANSKYAFLGSLRSTAQLISYELVLSSVVLLIVFITSSLNLSLIIELQRNIFFIIPLLPAFIIFFIASIAETNRAPFDLAEAESELVSGFMTEHSAVIFVFFFLAEYASIVLICILNSILFFGGYIFNPYFLKYIMYVLAYVFNLINIDTIFIDDLSSNDIITSSLLYYNNIGIYMLEGLYDSITLGVKTSIFIFIFIWVRASFPRIRFDQLMSFCWTVLLPIVIALILLVPCIILAFDVVYINI